MNDIQVFDLNIEININSFTFFGQQKITKIIDFTFFGQQKITKIIDFTFFGQNKKLLKIINK